MVVRAVDKPRPRRSHRVVGAAGGVVASNLPLRLLHLRDEGQGMDDPGALGVLGGVVSTALDFAARHTRVLRGRWDAVSCPRPAPRQRRAADRSATTQN